MKRLLLVFSAILYLLLFPLSGLHAESRKGNIKVEARFTSRVAIDGKESGAGVVFSSNSGKFIYPMEGATVTLVRGRDTLRHLSTDVTGMCVFRNISYGKYRVSISFVGYEDYTVEIEHKDSQTDVSTMMKESPILLSSIKVEGDIPLVIQRGDTIVVNPKAVETRSGAAAIEIVKQVPGIEISPYGSITAFGEPLKRTYVGGEAMFGHDFLAALKNIDADMVKDIQFYDELEEVSNVNGKREYRKVRAMNIETTRAFLASFAGHVIAGVGKDEKGGTGEEKIRYKGGLKFEMNSTGAALKAEAYYNNVGMRSSSSNFIEELQTSRFSGEKRLGAAEISFTKRKGKVFGDGSEYTFGYSYMHDNSTNATYLEREYGSGTDYTDREYRSDNVKGDISGNHKVTLNYKNVNSKRLVSSILFMSNTSFGNSERKNVSSYRNILDGMTTTVGDSLSQSMRNWNTSEYILVNIGKRKKVDITGNFSMGESRGDEFRKLEENSTFTDYVSTPKGRNLLANLRANRDLIMVNGATFTRKDEKNYRRQMTLRASVYGNYQNRRNTYLRYDVTNPSLPVFDMQNSKDYTYNFIKGGVEINLGYRLDSQNSNIFSNVYNLGIKGSLDYVGVNDADAVMDGVFRHDYIIPSAALYFDWKEFRFQYSFRKDIPAVEMIRDRIDDSNPLFLSAGNPDIMLPAEHEFRLGWYSGDPFNSISTFRIDSDFRMRDNDIIPYNVFYKDGTVLDEYGGYEVSPGATFSSYRNGPSSMEGNVSLKYSSRISALRTKYDLTLKGTYAKKPSYVQEELNMTDTYDAGFLVESNTSYRWFKLELSSLTSFTSSDNTKLSAYRYFNEKLKVKAGADIFKVWYISSAYDFILNKPVGGTSGIFNRNNILSVSTGVKLFKGRLTAGVSVFDVFNSSTDFKTMMYSDYVQNKWEPTFGRYISFDILFNLRSYKFK